MNRQYRRVLPLLTAAALAATPMQVLAESPQFAHDDATWERLRDNVMEYDELSLLVEEYNANYQNEQASYNDTKNDDDASRIRRDAKDSAQDMYDSAEDLRDQAEDLSSMADDLSDQAQEALDAGNPALAAQLRAGAASINPAERLDQAGLAVIHMPCGSNNHILHPAIPPCPPLSLPGRPLLRLFPSSLFQRCHALLCRGPLQSTGTHRPR